MSWKNFNKLRDLLQHPEKYAPIELHGINTTADKISFVPGSLNSLPRNRYKFDIIDIDGTIINAEKLYSWLKEHYSTKDNEGRKAVNNNALNCF